MRDHRKKVPFLLATGDDARKREKKRTHVEKPRAHEDRVASALGARRVPGSGAFEGSKGDVSQDRDREFALLTECKRTEGKASIGVKAEWLAKISREAAPQGKYPALSIEFDDEVMKRVSPNHPVESTWVAVPLSYLRALLGAAGEDL